MKDNRKFYLVQLNGGQYEGYLKNDKLICRETNPVLGYPRKNGKVLNIDFSKCKIQEEYIGARSYWRDTTSMIEDIKNESEEIKVEIRDIREFNNCGSFIAVADKEYFIKWKVNNGKYEYITEAPKNIINEIIKQFE